MRRLNEAISSIKNALATNKDTVRVHNTKFVSEVLKVLKQNGYLGDFTTSDDGHWLTVQLRYYKGKPAIKYVKMLSTCGSRVYEGKLTTVLRNPVVRILSTSSGVMSHVDAAAKGIGGQLLLEVF